MSTRDRKYEKAYQWMEGMKKQLEDNSDSDESDSRPSSPVSHNPISGLNSCRRDYSCAGTHFERQTPTSTSSSKINTHSKVNTGSEPDKSQSLLGSAISYVGSFFSGKSHHENATEAKSDTQK